MAPPSTQQQAAEAFVGALDYRGLKLEDGDRARLNARIAAAFAAGWVDQDLKAYLDLGGDVIKSPPHLYLYRLDPVRLPDAESYRAAQQGPLVGTDAVVAGWMDLSRQLGGHQPHQDSWRRLEEEGRNGSRPAGWEKYPHCGHPDCDEISRRREKPDTQGLPSLSPCEKCHPSMRF